MALTFFNRCHRRLRRNGKWIELFKFLNYVIQRRRRLCPEEKQRGRKNKNFVRFRNFLSFVWLFMNSSFFPRTKFFRRVKKLKRKLSILEIEKYHFSSFFQFFSKCLFSLLLKPSKELIVRRVKEELAKVFEMLW